MVPIPGKLLGLVSPDLERALLGLGSGVVGALGGEVSVEGSQVASATAHLKLIPIQALAVAVSGIASAERRALGAR